MSAMIDGSGYDATVSERRQGSSSATARARAAVLVAMGALLALLAGPSNSA
jgi:hypothetical protein